MKNKMPRPKLPRKINYEPKVFAFVPKTKSKVKGKVVMTAEERAAIILVDYLGYSQTEAAEKMHTSQSTLQRIVARGREKFAKFLNGDLNLKVERASKQELK